MDNVFFTHPENVTGERFELTGQEARHAAKVLRFTTGDELYASDGKGNLYRGEITSITKSSVVVDIRDTETESEPEIKKVLGFGAIKKRDRLEFAVEKAVELGAWEICIFTGDHSERSKINQDRLQSIALSAFKQSKRRWLPEIIYQNSLEAVLDHYEGSNLIMAHVDNTDNKPVSLTTNENVLLVGPEGGFSDREVALAREKGAECISLGKNRLRAETAVTAILSQYLFN